MKVLMDVYHEPHLGCIFLLAPPCATSPDHVLLLAGARPAGCKGRWTEDERWLDWWAMRWWTVLGSWINQREYHPSMQCDDLYWGAKLARWTRLRAQIWRQLSLEDATMCEVIFRSGFWRTRAWEGKEIRKQDQDVQNDTSAAEHSGVSSGVSQECLFECKMAAVNDLQRQLK